MSFRGLALSICFALAATACGGSGEPTGDEPAAAAASAEPIAISGIWEVEGVTTTLKTGQKRDISGTVVMAQSGSSYTATFDLDTTFPGADADLSADVIGVGKGEISGRTLTGTAETQLVAGTVPGVDSQFAFIPRMVSTRIESSSTATVNDDGSITIQIENNPAEGEDYLATHTSLTGRRGAAASSPGASADEG